MMTEAAKGVWAMCATSVIWGLSPLYFKALSHVPVAEMLAHRIVWACVFFVVVLGFQGRLWQVPPMLHGRALLRVIPPALLISFNWGVFIWSVQVGHAVEASMGYFIFPLVAIGLGMLVFGERLSRWQGVAVGCAVAAVLTLAAGLGVAPYAAILLALSFGLYGMVKKRVEAGPVLSVASEVAVLAPVALIWLWGLHTGLWAESPDRGAVFGQDLGTSLLLVAAGVLTGFPLILFSYAFRRASMSTLGLVQYINPSLQFMCAVAIFAEPVTRWHGIAFGLIWIGLVIFSVESLRQERAARKRFASVAGSGTTAL